LSSETASSNFKPPPNDGRHQLLGIAQVDPRFAEPIKAMIEEEPSFGYRTVAWLLGFNKNTVQRIFRIKGWQVRKRAIGMRPRIQAVPSVATAPNER